MSLKSIFIKKNKQIINNPIDSNDISNSLDKANTAPNIRVKKIKCSECEREYVVPLKANFMYFCPECKEYNGCECEYGFAPITPCYVFVGDKEIGTISGGGRESFYLISDKYSIDMKLSKGYKNLEVYHEAVSIIKKYIE